MPSRGEAAARRPYAACWRLHPFYGRIAGTEGQHGVASSHAQKDRAIMACRAHRDRVFMELGSMPQLLQWYVVDVRSGEKTIIC